MSYILEQERRYFFPVAKRLPVVLVRGEGCYVYDVEGRSYLDLVAGIACVSLGHGHPALVEAIKEQCQTLMHVSNLFYTVPQVEVAQLLCQATGLSRIFFCNSGAEAVEGCIKLARKWGKERRDGAYEIIVAQGAFHGRTLATLAAGGGPYADPFAPLPEGFVRVPFGDVEAIKRATGRRTAAVLLEPIQGENGVIVPPDDYLPAVRAWCQEAGILFMLDEVQTGMGRCGALFAHQLYNAPPDVMAVAKGLGGGFPIGAFMAREECAVLGPGDHGSTFGGNPLACRAALAVLRTMLEEDIPSQVAQKGQYLRGLLTELAQRHPLVREVRGKGLLWAVELSQDVAQELVLAALREGVLLNAVRPHVVRIAPPLVISHHQLAQGVEVLERCISRLEEG
jgi:predicted acetylornithine/succinylornithine family transaminase